MKRHFLWFKSLGYAGTISISLLFLILPTVAFLLYKNLDIQRAQLAAAFLLEPTIPLFSVLWPMHVLKTFFGAEAFEMMIPFRKKQLFRKWWFFLVMYSISSVVTMAFYMLLDLINLEMVIKLICVIFFINGFVFLLYSFFQNSIIPLITSILFVLVSMQGKIEWFPFYIRGIEPSWPTFAIDYALHIILGLLFYSTGYRRVIKNKD